MVYITFLFRKFRVKLIQRHFPNPPLKHGMKCHIPPLQSLRILTMRLSTVDEYKVLHFLSVRLTQSQRLRS